MAALGRKTTYAHESRHAAVGVWDRHFLGIPVRGAGHAEDRNPLQRHGKRRFTVTTGRRALSLVVVPANGAACRKNILVPGKAC